MNINNSKVNVQTQDILNVVLKQFDQKYLSKHCQGTANYIDKYYMEFSNFEPYGNADPFGDFNNAEKDSDTVGRGSAFVKFTPGTGVTRKDVTNTFTIEQATGGVAEDVNIAVEINFEEPIIGMPCVSMQENDGCFSGVNQLELSFQYNQAFEKCINIRTDQLPVDVVVSSSVSTQALSEDSVVVLRYYSLHPSQYAKLSKKSVIPYDEMVPYKLPFSYAGSNNQMSNIISLRQIPDKLYVTIRPKATALHSMYSNHTVAPITSINMTFNNVAGLLSDMKQSDLYHMSRRNGSQQVWNEFKGMVQVGNQSLNTIGSMVVIDCTRDLGLDDMLSASSLGQFSLQMTVSYEPIPYIDDYELVILANYAGLLVTQQGSSSTMSGLLTKEAVITAKSKGSSNIDYDDIQKVSGGNIYKQGKAEVGRLLKSERGRIARAVDDKADGAIDSAAKGLKAMAHDKLAKYY